MGTNAPVIAETHDITFVDLRDRIDAIKDVVAKGASNAQLNLFAQVAVSLQLNPFTGELYWLGGKIARPMIGRDGYLKLAQRSGRYRGMQSAVVYPDDEFECEYVNGVANVRHKPATMKGEYGQPVGAWAMLWMDDYTAPLYAYAPYMNHVRPGNDSPWATHPGDMIRKVAETHVLRRVCGDPSASHLDRLTVAEVDAASEVVVENAEAEDEPAARLKPSAAEVEAQRLLIETIIAVEDELAAANWDNWDQRNRRLGSRTKHVGTNDLSAAPMVKLETYLDHVREAQGAMDDDIAAGSHVDADDDATLFEEGAADAS